MILKIERHNYYNEPMAQDYWMLDDIRKYSLSVSNYFVIEEEVNKFNAGKYGFSAQFDYADIIILDHVGKFVRNYPSESKVKKIKYYNIIAGFSDGTEKVIVFDTLSYILNDNGKTIEKIVANYR